MSLIFIKIGGGATLLEQAVVLVQVRLELRQLRLPGTKCSPVNKESVKGRVHIFFYSRIGCPPIRGVPRVINDDAWHHLMTRGTLQKMLP